ncbi:hypothetical protein G7Z17_g633 [Cylindrodendrum hubeiense]|uniref:Uncharacterized protein n=1 Tax=Cylindrodendrum hubeiense TaxID=595255 RepID=A0A9P5HPD2_9HYPO|nr:hypothetical protein G7Z17_g633 [Cylindrodendrum hubeiense]
MRLLASVLASLSLLSLSLGQAEVRVPRYAIDESCGKKTQIAGKDKLSSRDGIIAAMTEAIERAQTSFKVMNEHGDDPRVSAIFKMVLGEENYKEKFEKVNAAKSEKNADSIAMLGIALELWDKKIMVDKDGELEEFQ